MNKRDSILLAILFFVIVLEVSIFFVRADLWEIIQTLKEISTKLDTKASVSAASNLKSSEACLPDSKEAHNIISQKTVYHTNSDFLKKSVGWFDEKYGDRPAWARPFGYGKANFAGMEVEWFAYCNSDGWLQFIFSRAISDEILAKMVSQKDTFGRNWEARNKEDGQGWLGESNCWINDAKLSDNGKAILDQANARIGKVTNTYMKVVEYLQ